MRILAVETSCDDTAVAVLDGWRPLASAVGAQEMHSGHGGVVPELASREHVRVLPRLVREVLSDAGMASPGEVDVMAATAGPGLVGALLVGLSWTKSAAYASGARFLAVNHLAAHLHAHYEGEDSVSFPAVALLASGGHTCILRMDSWSDVLLLGATRDDAAGEAFDKTAKLMGLGYPGGPLIDRLAEEGDPHAVKLPAPLPDPAEPDTSFSGLKTAVRLAWESGAPAADLAASFRKVVVDVLSAKLLHQAELTGARSVLVAGGVAANGLLRRRLGEICSERDLELHLPGPGMSTDNAIMVGRAAAALLTREPGACSPADSNAFARWTGERLEVLVAR